MSKDVRAIVVAGNGTNCEIEMAWACRLGGAEVVDIVDISDLMHGEARLEGYHMLNFPGGFMDGDDLGAAKAGANRIRHARIAGGEERLIDQIHSFISDGKLIFGICNGFQLLVKLALLPGPAGEGADQDVTLTFNDSGRFEDRWVNLVVDGASPCVFTRGIESICLPVRHGEGKFVPRAPEVAEDILTSHLAAVRYADGAGRPTLDYPANPNGSAEAVAGICDRTGRIFGLMPHPEAYLHYTNHPRWTREALPDEGAGVVLFRNAVNFIRENLI